MLWLIQATVERTWSLLEGEQQMRGNSALYSPRVMGAFNMSATLTMANARTALILLTTICFARPSSHLPYILRVELTTVG